MLVVDHMEATPVHTLVVDYMMSAVVRMAVMADRLYRVEWDRSPYNIFPPLDSLEMSSTGCAISIPLSSVDYKRADGLFYGWAKDEMKTSRAQPPQSKRGTKTSKTMRIAMPIISQRVRKLLVWSDCG